VVACEFEIVFLFENLGLDLVKMILLRDVREFNFWLIKLEFSVCGF